MKTTKRNFKALKTILMVLLVVVMLLGISTYSVFAASTEGTGMKSNPIWNVISIILIILDVIEIIAIVILILVLRKIKKKRKIQSQLKVLVLPFLLGLGFALGSLALFVVLFAVVADISFQVKEASSKPLQRDDKKYEKPDGIYDYNKDDEEERKRE